MSAVSQRAAPSANARPRTPLRLCDCGRSGSSCGSGRRRRSTSSGGSPRAASIRRTRCPSQSLGRTGSAQPTFPDGFAGFPPEPADHLVVPTLADFDFLVWEEGELVGSQELYAKSFRETSDRRIGLVARGRVPGSWDRHRDARCGSRVRSFRGLGAVAATSGWLEGNRVIRPRLGEARLPRDGRQRDQPPRSPRAPPRPPPRAEGLGAHRSRSRSSASSRHSTLFGAS